MSAIAPLHHWTRAEYERMVESGAFKPGARFELLDGEIIAMSPQGPQHVTSVQLVAEALRERLPPGCVVRVQAPIALDDDSEPEPDICVVRGQIRDYARSHPSAALLVIEVADSSLEHDRTDKARAYARNEIPEYWVINVKERIIEVYTQPWPTGYGCKTIRSEQDFITSASVAVVQLAVVELLP
ncbi:MAG TPA: Uma2 family endonuclease [Lamprocystis sp. (in: g-proteobacteria)]|nr:Uma2 family endonuclease [Lamprocystis sp. (in: g-proteobacteria)]